MPASNSQLEGSLAPGQDHVDLLFANAAADVVVLAAGQIGGAVKDRIRTILRSPDMIARTFRAAQDQAKERAAELAQQKARLEKRLRELRKAIGRLIQVGGNGDGALAEELRTLNEEYAELEGQVREVDGQVEAIGAGGPTEDEVREALQTLDPAWDELFPAERERIVRLLIKEALLSADGLNIAVRTNGLRSLATELADGAEAKMAEDGATVTVHVPMIFKVRGGRKEIILPPDAHTTPDVGPRRPIVLALARAYKWQEMLDSAEVASLDDLAERYGVDRSYVSRIIKLAVLAPDIADSVLLGTEPGGMSLVRLRGHVPLVWEKQRRVVGFSSSARQEGFVTVRRSSHLLPMPPRWSGPRGKPLNLTGGRLPGNLMPRRGSRHGATHDVFAIESSALAAGQPREPMAIRSCPCCLPGTVRRIGRNPVN